MCKTRIIIALLCHLVLLDLIFGCSNNGSTDRNIPGQETKVVNLSNETYDVYIGRGIEYHTHMLARDIKSGEEGWLGNPHPIGWCDICSTYHTRDECIQKFKEDFYKKIKSDAGFKKSVLSLQGNRLGCYCKPKNCHGDIIKQWIEDSK